MEPPTLASNAGTVHHAFMLRRSLCRSMMCLGACTTIALAGVQGPTSHRSFGDCAHAVLRLQASTFLTSAASLSATDGNTAVLGWSSNVSGAVIEISHRTSEGAWISDETFTQSQLGGVIPRGVAVSGDVVLVSTSQGLWFIERTPAGWSITSSIPLALQSTGPQAIAIEGALAAVGDVNADITTSNSGAVHTFQRIGESWSLDATIGPPAGSVSRGFGASVTIADGRVFVGEPGLASSVNFGGELWILERQRRGWQVAASVKRPDGVGYIGWGASCATDGTELFVGAPSFDGAQNNSGRADRFLLTEGVWTFTESFSRPDPFADDQFGADVSFDGDWLAIGRPQVSPHDGRAHLYRREGSLWIDDSSLGGSLSWDAFGASLTVRGGDLLVSARRLLATFRLAEDCDANGEVDGCQGYGSVDLQGDVVAPVSAATVAQFHFRNAPQAIDEVLIEAYGALPSNLPTAVLIINGFTLGSVSLSPIGGCGTFEETAGFFVHKDLFNQLVGPTSTLDATWTFPALVGECPASSFTMRCRYPTLGDVADLDDNGILDACADCDDDGVTDDIAIAAGFDCNGNGRLDACDIAVGLEADCDGNGVLDRCESMVAGDAGEADLGWVTSSSYPRSIMVCRREVTEGMEVVGGVHYGWNAYSFPVPAVPPDAIAYVLVYSDPNQDGHPSDAIKLAQVPVTPPSADTRWTTIDIPDLNIGPVGTSYFLAMAIQFGPSAVQRVFGPCDEIGIDTAESTWLGISPLTTPWAPELGSLEGISLQGAAMSTAWVGTRVGLIRAVSPEGTICPTGAARSDFDGDGVVGASDLAILLGAWATAGPGDLDGDGVVGSADLALFLGDWPAR